MKKILLGLIVVVTFVFAGMAPADARMKTAVDARDKCPPIFDCPPGFRKQDGLCVECN
jgi:hypothetical protein